MINFKLRLKPLTSIAHIHIHYIYCINHSSLLCLFSPLRKTLTSCSILTNKHAAFCATSCSGTDLTSVLSIIHMLQRDMSVLFLFLFFFEGGVYFLMTDSLFPLPDPFRYFRSS